MYCTYALHVLSDWSEEKPQPNMQQNTTLLLAFMSSLHYGVCFLRKTVEHMEGLTKENGEGENKTNIYNKNISFSRNEVESREALLHTLINHGQRMKNRGVIIFDNSYL